MEHEPNTFQSFIAPYKPFSLEPEIEATIIKAGELAKRYAVDHSQNSFYREKRINSPDLILDSAYIDRLVKGHLKEIEDTRNGRNVISEFLLIIFFMILIHGLGRLLMRIISYKKHQI